jgi:hypothetical protein
MTLAEKDATRRRARLNERYARYGGYGLLGVLLLLVLMNLMPNGRIDPVNTQAALPSQSALR